MTVRARVFCALILSAAILSAAACGGSGSSPSNLPTAPFSQTDIRVGTGADAVNGRTLSVNYSLWLYDPAGAELKGRHMQTGPYSFVLGTGNAIRGWHVGLLGMKAGGLRRLIIPPDLAYGSSGQGDIPPNATLVFDVELLSVQ
jgi:FKBP-type peptidyl-prolyl cis-trans isomerase FkpA